MALKEKLKSDIESALKSRNEKRVNTLRFVLSSIQSKEIEKRGKSGDSVLTEEEIIDVLGKEAKKRKEAYEIYVNANRLDLAGKEKEELEIIQEYMPEQLNEEEIRKKISELIPKFDIKDPKNFGRIMSEAMKEMKGKADASLVSGILKSEMEKG